MPVEQYAQQQTTTSTKLVSAGPTLSPQEIELEYTALLPNEKLTVLCQSIDKALPPPAHSIIHFVSPYGREGAGIIAFETALVSATQNGKRVLFVELSQSRDRVRRALSESLDFTFRLSTDKTPRIPLAWVKGTSLYYTNLYLDSQSPISPVNSAFLKDWLDQLKPAYDQIILHVESGMASNLGASCAGLADGVIIVLEAERTRWPVARQLKEMIDVSGGRIIGTVLNRQRHYIPRWLYSLLFKREG